MTLPSWLQLDHAQRWRHGFLGAIGSRAFIRRNSKRQRNTRFTLSVSGDSLSCPIFQDFEELEAFLLGDARTQKLEEHTLNALRLRTYTLKTEERYIVTNEALSRITPGKRIQLDIDDVENDQLSTFYKPIVNKPKIVCVGDSNLQQAIHYGKHGLGNRLVEEFGDEYHIDIHGFAGMNTEVGKEILSVCLPNNDLVVLVISLLTNDCCFDDRNVPIHRYRQNIREMIMNPKVREQGAKIIFLTGPPSKYETHNVPGKGEIRERNDMARYVQELIKIGQSHGHLGVSVINFFDLVLNEPFNVFQRDDEIHLDTNGHALLSKQVIDRLKKVLSIDS